MDVRALQSQPSLLRLFRCNLHIFILSSCCTYHATATEGAHPSNENPHIHSVLSQLVCLASITNRFHESAIPEIPPMHTSMSSWWVCNQRHLEFRVVVSRKRRSSHCNKPTEGRPNHISWVRSTNRAFFWWVAIVHPEFDSFSFGIFDPYQRRLTKSDRPRKTVQSRSCWLHKSYSLSTVSLSRCWKVNTHALVGFRRFHIDS